MDSTTRVSNSPATNGKAHWVKGFKAVSLNVYGGIDNQVETLLAQIEELLGSCSEFVREGLIRRADGSVSTNSLTGLPYRQETASIDGVGLDLVIDMSETQIDVDLLSKKDEVPRSSISEVLKLSRPHINIPDKHLEELIEVVDKFEELLALTRTAEAQRSAASGQRNLFDEKMLRKIRLTSDPKYDETNGTIHRDSRETVVMFANEPELYTSFFDGPTDAAKPNVDYRFDAGHVVVFDGAYVSHSRPNVPEGTSTHRVSGLASFSPHRPIW